MGCSFVEWWVIGLCQLCRHDFEHNRLAKALSTMPGFLFKCAMRAPIIQQNINTLHLNTAVHIKKMCNVISFIIS